MMAQVDPFCKGLYFACPIPLEPAIRFGHVYEEHSKVRFAGTVAYLFLKKRIMSFILRWVMKGI